MAMSAVITPVSACLPVRALTMGAAPIPSPFIDASGNPRRPSRDEHLAFAVDRFRHTFAQHDRALAALRLHGRGDPVALEAWSDAFDALEAASARLDALRPFSRREAQLVKGVRA